jgi:hypothetical protein
MKQPARSHSDPISTTKQLPPKLRQQPAAEAPAPEALAAIQFPVEGLNAISVSLPVRTMKRAEPRWALRLGRAALLTGLLTALLSPTAQLLWQAELILR